MGRVKITSRGRLDELLPQAVQEGWTIQKLAVESRCGRRAASRALRAHVALKAQEADTESGRTVEAMRREALAERERVVARLAKVGALCDALLAETESLLNGIAGTRLGTAGEATLSEGEDAGRGVSPLQIASLEQAATILVKAGKVAEVSWKLFRSASGLELAERLTEFRAREAMKAGRDEPDEWWEADFTLLEG